MTDASLKPMSKIAQDVEQTMGFNGMTGHDKDYYGCLVDDLVEACQEHSEGDSGAPVLARKAAPAGEGAKTGTRVASKRGSHGG